MDPEQLTDTTVEEIILCELVKQNGIAFWELVKRAVPADSNSKTAHKKQIVNKITQLYQEGYLRYEKRRVYKENGGKRGKGLLTYRMYVYLIKRPDRYISVLNEYERNR